MEISVSRAFQITTPSARSRLPTRRSQAFESGKRHLSGTPGSPRTPAPSPRACFPARIQNPKVKENGCSNTSILAYNSACTPELGEHSNGGAYWWKKKGSIALPQSQGKDEKFPIRGACGTPGNNDQIFVSPDPGHGFLGNSALFY